MNDYLFALVCVVGVIVILGFFSIVIYLSGLFFSRSEKSDNESSGSEVEAKMGEKTGLKESGSEEELRKVAVVAAVVAMLKEQGKAGAPSMIKRARSASQKRYPSPWMQVRE